MAYAEGTTVSPEKSRAEIERLVRNHGAIKVGSFSDQEKAVVTFATADRMVKFSVPLPLAADPEIRKKATPRGRWSPTDDGLRKAVEAEERRRWRCLLLAIKAIDEAFLAHIVTPGGATIMEEIRTIERNGGQLLLGAAR